MLETAGKSPLDHENLLRSSGFNVTNQRIAVLNAVSKIPHASAEEIIDLARKEVPALSRQAVFDALNAFTEKGIIRRIQPASSPARYEDRIDDNHHHVVCRSCGDTRDVDCAVNYRPCLQASDSQGFNIEEAEVIYWGTCPQCQSIKQKI